MPGRWRCGVGAGLAAAAIAAAVWTFNARAPRDATPRRILPAGDSGSVTGVVLEGEAPVAGARVRWRGEARFTATDGEGKFALPPPGSTALAPVVAASKEGYVIAGTAWRGQPLEIQLAALPSHDDLDYAWVDPTPGPAETHNCGNCHGEIYREWQAGGHAHSATNPRFVGLYGGADWQGEPGHGWSLLDEHPLGAGVCAACHAPTVEFAHPAADDLRLVSGVAAQGVHCDFCHKVQEVDLANVGLTHGRFGMKLLRPAEDQLFFGPLDDVTRGEDAHSPLQTESRYCASCHEGTVFGVHVYSTYSEWLVSPARRRGRQCQSCHMAPTGLLTNLAPNDDGIERDPATLASHALLPGGREAMLRRCLAMTIDGRRSGASAVVTVTLTARDVGHSVPTGFIDRHLILVVEPRDATGEPLPVESSVAHADELPLLPSAAGSELAGKPGRLFAKLLADERGDPIPFWRGAPEPLDTRLAPETPTAIEFRFSNAASVRVRLLYRRFWVAVANEKSWPDDTIIVHDETWPAD